MNRSLMGSLFLYYNLLPKLRLLINYVSIIVASQQRNVVDTQPEGLIKTNLTNNGTSLHHVPPLRDHLCSSCPDAEDGFNQTIKKGQI